RMLAMREEENRTAFLSYTKTSKRNFPAYNDTYGLESQMQTARQHGNNCQEHEHGAREHWEHLTQNKVTTQSRCCINA
ncbi:hypothetical protein IscW_ISCW002754, partial [Ixodes scapularis]